MDYLEKQNALAEKELEARLRGIYKQAYKGVKKTADDYLDDLEGRIKTEFKKYEAGDYTPAEFAQWVKTQEARGERYKKMVDDIATRAVNVNKTASDLINGTTPSAYALNANYTAYQIEKGYNMANFELVNEEALKSVLDGTNNVEFRTVKTNPVRDYAWNKKQIENGLLAGILQGQSIPKLADTFLQVMGRNENSAYRNARTALGSACNAGTLNTMKRGEDMGINVRKQWQSAKDGRVRDSHAFLNGQIRDIDKPFDNGLMYPCDSSGHPSEVYNCRCRLAYILPKYNDEQSREAYSDDKQSNETYRQWLKRKQEEQKTTLEPIATPTSAKSEELTNRRKQRLTERGTSANASKKQNTEEPKKITIKIKPTTNYKIVDIDDFKRMQHSITKDERKVIYGKGHFSGYVNSSNARKLNEAIRENKPLSAEYQKIKDTLQSVISRNKIEENVIVTRYVNSDALENITGLALNNPMKLKGADYVKYVQDEVAKAKAGFVDTEHNFLSASLVKDKNVMSNKAVEMKIKVPAGKNCYITTNKKESEVIFDIDTQLVLEKVTYDTTRTPYTFVAEYEMRL